MRLQPHNASPQSNLSAFPVRSLLWRSTTYAIISHTWGNSDEEATFQDLRDGNGIDKPGFLKIKACCDQAVRDGLNYVWIDTCCIDKTNSVELQEAINSMFTWYKKSAVCYAYLSDCYASVINVEEFKASKWFTRGWTLQELIAPAKVVFYNRNWKPIGDRTGFCLLGIFGVHMPLIYGEGGVEAFIRLQKSIMEQSDDYSLFAWKQNQGPEGHGLLATAPGFFAGSSSIVRKEDPTLKTAYRLTNRGLEIQLRLTCNIHGGDHIALLDCGEGNNNNTIGIYVALSKDGRFVRIHPHQHISKPQNEVWPALGFKWPVLKTIYVPQVVLFEKPDEEKFDFQIVFRRETGIERYEFPNRDMTLEPSVIIMFVSPMPTRSNNFRLRYEGMSSHYFRIANSTSPGRAGLYTNMLSYSLGIGGRAGILLYALNSLDLFFKSFSKSLFGKLDCLAVVFGVGLDGLVFVSLVKVGRRDFDDDRISSFEKFVASAEEHTQMTASIYTAQFVRLKVDIVVETLEGRVVHMVYISEY